ncbi:MAG: fimbrillin family protein [Muribaculaceae bacterium]|nr:fimbrillin family protein [Muribaculaceae bacterium]
MKLKVLLMGFAALALASCSSEDDIDVNQGHAIGFRPALGSVSRATEINNSNLSAITVSAFMGQQELFGDLGFTKGNQGFFTSNPEYYWPGDDTPLTFYAYSPSTPGGTMAITAETKTLKDFSPANNLGDQIDFITSTATGKKSTNEAEGVELTFNHQLSQIEIQAKTDNKVYTYEVTGIKIGKPVSKASYNFDNKEWTPASDRAIYSDTYNTPVTLGAEAVSLMGDGGNAMLIPQQLTAWDPINDATNSNSGAYLALKLRIATKDTGVVVYPFPSNPDNDWAAIPIDTNWEAGKKYIYTLDLTHGAGFVDPEDPGHGTPVLGDAIKFSVNVVDWDEAESTVDMKTK